MEIFSETKIDFISKRYVYFIASTVMIFAGIASLLLKGASWGIDFSGGYLLQLGLSMPVEINEMRTAVASAVSNFEIQNIVGSDDIIIRVEKTEKVTEEMLSAIESKVFEKIPNLKIRWDRVEYVGPTVGEFLIRQAMYAVIFSLLGIVLYVAIRFKSFMWGAAGVLALAHDVFIVFGLLSLLNREITLTVVAALLTLAGYSINDTIVIYDRIREKMKILPKEKLSNVINISINDTLSRTLVTSLSAFFVVVVLFFLGGPVLHDFALVLMVGIVVGTYSSICVAAPIVYEWQTRKAEGRSKK